MSDKRGVGNKKRRGNTNDKRSRAERNIGWIEEYCRIPEGPDVAKPVVLRPFQRKEIRKIYDNPHRTRLAILSFGRKGLENAAETIVTACSRLQGLIRLLRKGYRSFSRQPSVY